MAIPAEFQVRKLFTIKQANAVLPLVRAIAVDLSTLAKEVMERKERLGFLLAGRERGLSDPYSEELAQIEDSIESDNARLYEFVQELRELGVEPKNSPEGLIDFPALHDGRVVYLCWKVGESEVGFWHELDAGFRGRQILLPGQFTVTEKTESPLKIS